MKRVKIAIEGMTCASCVASVEKSLNRLEGIQAVSVNLATNRAIIDYADSINEKAFVEAIERVGFDASIIVDQETVHKTFRVEGMTCASCASSIDIALKRLKGIHSSHVNVATDKVSIEYDPSVIRLSEIKQAIDEVGYTLILEQNTDTSVDPDETKMQKARRIMRLSVSISAVMMTLMIIHMFIIMIPYYTYIVAVMGIPVVFVLGYPVHKASIKSLKNRRPNMDVLVSLGSLPPYLIGLLGLFMPITTFIEMATTIMTFHLLGKYLESRAKGKASQAIKKLLALSAKTANVLIDGKEMEIATEELSIGDIMVIRPGEKIPTDGVIVFGKSTIDESMATGESMPVNREVHDNVIGATVNKNGIIHVKVTKIGKDTFLSKVIELVEACQGSKVPIQEFADRITGYFVPAILGLTALTFVSFLVFTDFHVSILRQVSAFLPWVNPNQNPLTLAFVTATAVLVIACPCALGLGTPTALMVGSGLGAENGILIRNGEAVQTLKDVKAIAFDKTGTLTHGKPKVTDMLATEDETQLLDVALALEHASEHPLALAIVEKGKAENREILTISDFSSLTGKGLVGTLSGQTALIGNEKLMDEYQIDYSALSAQKAAFEDEAKTVMMVAYGQKLLGLIAVADTLKSSAKEAIRRLNAIGIETVMITGDNPRTAKAIASRVGMKHVVSGVLPEGKVDEIKRLQAQFGLVAMVGDGINDAPALKQANIGIAIGTGTDIAIEASDVTLINDDLDTLVLAIGLSKAIFKKIKENYFWAWFYNAIAIPFAALGLLHPMIGAAAMSLSSLNVIYNSLRLKRLPLFKKEAPHASR